MLLVVGANGSGECGVNNKHQHLLHLTDFHADNKDNFADTPINHVYNGKGFTVYADTQHRSLYASGDNKHYSCCVHTTAEKIGQPQLIAFFNNKVEKVTTTTKNVYKDKSSAKKPQKREHYKRKQKKTRKVAERVNVEFSVSTSSAAKGNDIRVKRVCVNVSGFGAFFISENNKVYANGNNRNFQLGLDQHHHGWFSKGFQFMCEPKAVSRICSNLIDIKSSSAHSIALRLSDHGVMLLYCGQSRYARGVSMPYDVMNLIVAYVGKLSDTDCAIYESHRWGWRPIGRFMHTHIIEIDVGETHYLALDGEGTVWAWGSNRFLQCGLPRVHDGSELKNIGNAMYITYFKENGVKIKTIKCGWNHSLALDIHGKVYAFGSNAYGQCALDSKVGTTEPVCVKLPDGAHVTKIECGANHSAVGTKDGKWYMFGKNHRNQCLTNDGRSCVTTPFCINGNVAIKTKGKIRKVSLGVDNTQIFVV